MKTIYILCAAFIGLFLLSQCGKVSVDNEDPQIEVFLINGQSSIASAHAGQTLQLELFITDNERLAEILVRLENMSNTALTATEKMIFFEVFSDINAKEFSEVLSMSLSEDVLAGRYRLMVQVADANGNSQSRVEEFRIFNTSEEPEIMVSSFVPAASGGVLNLAPGDSLMINGYISDVSGIDEFRVQITGASSLYNQLVEIEESDFTFYDLEWLGAIQISANANPGNYTLSIDVRDNDGHMSFYSHPLQVQ